MSRTHRAGPGPLHAGCSGLRYFLTLHSANLCAHLRRLGSIYALPEEHASSGETLTACSMAQPLRPCCSTECASPRAWQRARHEHTGAEHASGLHHGTACVCGKLYSCAVAAHAHSMPFQSTQSTPRRGLRPLAWMSTSGEGASGRWTRSARLVADVMPAQWPTHWLPQHACYHAY